MAAGDENPAPPRLVGDLRYGTAMPLSDVNVNGKRSAAPLEWGPRKKPCVIPFLVFRSICLTLLPSTTAATSGAQCLRLRTSTLCSWLACLLGMGKVPPTAEERRALRVFVKLVDMVPSLEDLLHISPPERISAIAVMIQKGANAARSDDTRSLKSAVIDWIAPASGEPIHPHIPKHSKVDRGFNHDITGALLCPTSLDWSKEEYVYEMFPTDRSEISPSSLQCRDRHALRNKEIIAGGTDWPVFLYENEKPDPEDMWRGLFRGRLLILGFKHVFISPSSAEDISRATRAGNARINGMTHVTPASIAYIATQVRFALSSSSTFCRTDKDGESELFYHSILEILEDPDEAEEVKALLAWWNRKVFPAASNGVRIAPAHSAFSRLKAKT
ncbi:hypothetical protein NMY22_g14718 [Coprinellus aureogranulatus]|nr:hypothetical protein NMY22_g14718 [Coprinellus aureogranulatus]